MKIKSISKQLLALLARLIQKKKVIFLALFFNIVKWIYTKFSVLILNDCNQTNQPKQISFVHICIEQYERIKMFKLKLLWKYMYIKTG